MTMRSRACFLGFLLAAAMVSACGSGSSESIGSLSLNLSDAASSDYKAVYVTIKEVQVHRGEDAEAVWYVVATPNKTYNLLHLVNGVMEELGLSSLETGAYTQMRLLIGTAADSRLNILGQSHPYVNYFIDGLNDAHELRVPSGYQSGVKLVHQFGIVEGLTTELVLDFDVERSIVKAGTSGNWQLKPTIKVIGTINKAVLSGVITDEAGFPIQGARVSAQKYNQGAHEVNVYGSTLTTDTGEYQIYLDPDLYTVVAYKDGYMPACSLVMTGSNEYFEQSFVLPQSAMATISCNVSLPAGVQDQVVAIHFLRAPLCDDANLIEVKTVNVSQTGSYKVDLPTGAYVVIATDGTTTLPGRNAATGSAVTLDFAGH